MNREIPPSVKAVGVGPLSMLWIATLWAVTFPGATWSLAILFHRAVTAGAEAQKRPPQGAARKRSVRVYHSGETPQESTLFIDFSPWIRAF